MSKPIVFKTPLHRKIFEDSSRKVFEVGSKEIEILKASKTPILSIKNFKFQTVQISPQSFIIFKVKGNKKEDDFEYKNKKFFTGGKQKEIEVIKGFKETKKELTNEEYERVLKEHQEFIDDLTRIEEEKINDISTPPSNEVKVEESKEVKTEEKKEETIDTSLFEPITKPQKYSEIIEEIGEESNSKKTKPKKKTEDQDFLLQPENTIFKSPVNLNKKGIFWYTSTYNFNETEKFWKELKQYYKANSKEIEEKLNLLDSSELPPIFSKKNSNLNLNNLQETFVEKISFRVQELEEEKQKIEGELQKLDKELVGRGYIPSESEDYNKLISVQKGISECIENSKKALKEYSKEAKEFEAEAKEIEERFFVDIHGQPEIASRYQEKILDKLLEINKEINKIHQKHLDLENLLIKRLRGVSEAKHIEEKIRRIEQEEILEAFREDNKEFFAVFESRRRKDVIEKLGDLHESTAEIYKKIEEEKQRIQYYMDNLNNLEKYENYETHLFHHKKKKQSLRKHSDEFNRYVYKLKLLVLKKEKKFDSFFEKTNREVFDFRKEIEKLFTENYSLSEVCLKEWKSKWEVEATPCVDALMTRSSQMIETFASIPPTQIIKIYNLKQRLLDEANSRQREWKRIYEEVKLELKKNGYLLNEPLPSELDSKYIDELKKANLKLSPSTHKALFICPSTFSLAVQKDVTIGLEPKTLDDDNFAVIDQVWTTLTPEQEQKLKEKIEGIEEMKRKQSLKETIQELMESKEKRTLQEKIPKRESFERYSRILTQAEKESKMGEIENTELRLWESEHYLISNSRGEFKDTIYNITKKLFKNKSVRMVNSELQFTDDGYVADGETEIFSPKDYFIKPEDKNIFSDAQEIVDIREDEKLLSEPDEEALELISDPEYVSRMAQKYSKPTNEGKLDIESIVRTGLDHWKENGKVFELDVLREKLLKLNDEIKLIKDYHQEKSEQLEIMLSEKYEIFEDMKSDLDEMKLFLEDKEKELEKIIEKTEENLSVNLSEINENLYYQEEPAKPKGRITKWFNRIMYGDKECKNEDRT